MTRDGGLKPLVRQCDEIHIYAGEAERTRVIVEVSGFRSHFTAATSMRDLVRRYKLYGDGLYYMPVGHWPFGQTTLKLDNLKWLGFERSFHSRRKLRRI